MTTERPSSDPKGRLRVLHLTHSFLPFTVNWIYNQIRFNTACEATVLCQFRQNRDAFPFERVIAAHERPTVIAHIDDLITRLRAQYRRSLTRRAIADARPQVVHGHFAFESWRHLAEVRRAGTPLVTTFYGLDVDKLPRRAAWRRRYRVLFSYGAAFMVEGPFMGRRLEALGCPAGKIHVVHIGVDVEAVRAARSASTDGPTTVLFVGLGREKKGAPDAVAAFVKAAVTRPSLRLELVGDGRFRETTRRMIAGAGMSDRCRFHGTVPVREYLPILGRAGILLAPSVTAADGDTEGGAPVTVIEAQVAGIPVAGTTHCDIPEIVEHGRTGLLCAEHDVDALAANLGRLADDAELRRAMGARGSERATQRHDIRRQVERIAAIYRAVAGS